MTINRIFANQSIKNLCVVFLFFVVFVLSVSDSDAMNSISPLANLTWKGTYYEYPPERIETLAGHIGNFAYSKYNITPGNNREYFMTYGKGKKIVMTARQHGDEAAGSFMMEGFLLSTVDDWQGFRKKYEVLGFPMVNPDGAKKITRNNSFDSNLNRLWNTYRQSEVNFAKNYIYGKNISLFIDMHGLASGETTGYVIVSAKNSTKAMEMCSRFRTAFPEMQCWTGTCYDSGILRMWSCNKYDSVSILIEPSQSNAKYTPYYMFGMGKRLKKLLMELY